MRDHKNMDLRPGTLIRFLKKKKIKKQLLFCNVTMKTRAS